MDNFFEIKSTEYWFKVVDMLQQNWALIDKSSDSNICTVFFIHDESGVFDEMKFSSVEEACQGLEINGFKRYSEEGQIQKYITPPKPPFQKANHPNGPIYSSGRYWH